MGINFIWEMAQMPLYRDMPFSALSSWWFCLRASVGDGVIVLTIWAIGAALRRQFKWFTPLGLTSVTILLLSGAMIAVAVEIQSTNTGRWAYSEFMPILPVVGAGVSPFVQSLVLPLVSMKLAMK